MPRGPVDSGSGGESLRPVDRRLRILLVDNYDSFVYNLVQELGELGAEPTVARNDATSVAEIAAASPRPDAIVISPGPGRPEAAGISVEVVSELAATFPILGVCLGHQSIAVAYGASVSRAPEIVHGKTSSIAHSGRGIFAGLPNPFEATRYHSLAVERGSLPDELVVDAETPDGIVMALSHRDLPVFGVQFHPESILTKEGPRMLGNFLEIARHFAGCPDYSIR